MADGGEGAFDSILCVSDLLKAMKNDVKLYPVTVTQTVAFLADVVGDAKDAEEVKASLPDEAPDWVQMFAEAWSVAVERALVVFPTRAHMHVFAAA